MKYLRNVVAPFMIFSLIALGGTFVDKLNALVVKTPPKSLKEANTAIRILIHEKNRLLSEKIEQTLENEIKNGTFPFVPGRQFLGDDRKLLAGSSQFRNIAQLKDHKIYYSSGRIQDFHHGDPDLCYFELSQQVTENRDGEIKLIVHYYVLSDGKFERSPKKSEQIVMVRK